MLAIISIHANGPLTNINRQDFIYVFLLWHRQTPEHNIITILGEKTPNVDVRDCKSS